VEVTEVIVATALDRSSVYRREFPGAREGKENIYRSGFSPLPLLPSLARRGEERDALLAPALSAVLAPALSGVRRGEVTDTPG
jgi:hypothetical protein